MQTNHMNLNHFASNEAGVESCENLCLNGKVKKHKRGDIRDDGKVFLGYYKGYESWVTQEQLNVVRSKAAEYQKRYYRENRNKVLANEKSCYEKHRASRLLSRKRYCKENREKISEYGKRYIEQNRGLVYANNSNARARRRAAMPVDVNKKLIASFYDQANRLSESWSASHIEPKFRVKFHVDHIAPLSRGGLHHPSNLQVVPAVWNLRKNNNSNYPLPSAYANSVATLIN